MGCPPTETYGECGLTDHSTSYDDVISDACKGCRSRKGPGYSGAYTYADLVIDVRTHWSSISMDTEKSAFYVNFEAANINFQGTTMAIPETICVRDPFVR